MSVKVVLFIIVFFFTNLQNVFCQNVNNNVLFILSLKSDTKSQPFKIIATNYNVKTKHKISKDVLIYDKNIYLVNWKTYDKSGRKLLSSIDYTYDKGLLESKRVRLLDYFSNTNKYDTIYSKYAYNISTENQLLSLIELRNNTVYKTIDSIKLNEHSLISEFNISFTPKSNNISNTKVNQKINNNYNDKKQLIEIKTFLNSGNSIIKKYTYNKDGFINSKHILTVGPLENVAFNDFLNKNRVETKMEYKDIYEYELDKRGNWIKRFKVINGKKHIEIKRKITYY